MAVSLSTLRSLHPEWNIVDFMEAPNGGIWAVGADGGVFTLNAEGNQGEGEAPFLGSYHSDFLAPHRNDPNRTFEGIEASGESGYRIVTAGGGGTGYDFAGIASAAINPPADLGPQQGATPTATNPDETSGKALFRSSLIQSGFTPGQADSLVAQLYTTSKTVSSDEELWISLRDTTEYKTRFGGIVALRERAAGGEYVPYIPSEGDYVTTEEGYQKVARDAGLPATFYDEPSDFANLIGGGVSVSEYSTRVGMGTQAALGTDPTLRDELARIFGVTLGDLTAFFLDPDKAQGVLERNFASAQVGTASKRSGFGMLTIAEIDTLTGRGLTPERAGAGMADVAGASALESELAGETMTGDNLTRSQQLGLATGEGADVAAFERRRRSRQAAFGGGGGAAGGGAGTQGIGSAR